LTVLGSKTKRAEEVPPPSRSLQPGTIPALGLRAGTMAKHKGKTPKQNDEPP
jgi:hypothetical protein